MATVTPPINVDMVIRYGTEGQSIDADVGIDLTEAVSMWLLCVNIQDVDISAEIELECIIHPDDVTHMRYVTTGSEFTPGHYYVISYVDLGDNVIKYSENRRVLHVKSKYEE